MGLMPSVVEELFLSTLQPYPSLQQSVAQQRRQSRKALWLSVSTTMAFLVCEFLVFTKISTQWDTNTFILFNDFLPNSPLSTLMICSSKYGREVVWSALVIILGLSNKQSHRRGAFYLVVTIGALVLLGDTAKMLLFRSRPFMVVTNGHYLLPPESDSSFPSGHSLVVSGGATVLWFTLTNRKVSLALTLEAGLVSFSRIYVGAHFPMDVIGGILFGIAVAGCVMVFQNRLDREVFLKLDILWQRRVLRRRPSKEIEAG
jgi:membrane-associated phospholipid phosphatase